jgi:hypothetical protein
MSTKFRTWTPWDFVGGESCKSENFRGQSIAPSFRVGKEDKLGFSPIKVPSRIMWLKPLGFLSIYPLAKAKRKLKDDLQKYSSKQVHSLPAIRLERKKIIKEKKVY